MVAGDGRAGDQSAEAPVAIPSANDGLVKQVTTCVDAARLFVLLADNSLVGTTGGSTVATANSEMLAKLHRAVMGAGAPSLVARAPLGPSFFSVLESKIDVGTLKPNDVVHVFSEAMIVKQAAAPMREFVVVWQNVKDAMVGPHGDLARIRDIIQKTMDAHP